jgi:hypothetical protein
MALSFFPQKNEKAEVLCEMLKLVISISQDLFDVALGFVLAGPVSEALKDMKKEAIKVMSIFEARNFGKSRRPVSTRLVCPGVLLRIHQKTLAMMIRTGLRMGFMSHPLLECAENMAQGGRTKTTNMALQ